jgi:tellurite resistance protein TerC
MAMGVANSGAGLCVVNGLLRKARANGGRLSSRIFFGFSEGTARLARVTAPISLWLGFNAAILGLLALDLGLFSRGDRAPSTRRLLLTTLVWIALALAFGTWLALRAGSGKSLEFFTGYLIEYALSLDNIFLFVLIFSSFGITPARQRRVLFWGVIGALVMRGLMILAGVALLERFSWVFYLFGAYIVYAGVNLFLPKKHAEVEDRRIVKLARRVLPLSAETDSPRFTVRENGHLRFTLLFLVLIVVEVTDLIFALDSIPAIFGVTTDPFIVYTSNACAILGLRSLYFLLARAVKNLAYLQVGLGAVLIFIGAKMLLKAILPISTGLSLAVVGGILAVAIAASLIAGPKTEAHAHS